MVLYPLHSSQHLMIKIKIHKRKKQNHRNRRSHQYKLKESNKKSLKNSIRINKNSSIQNNKRIRMIQKTNLNINQEDKDIMKARKSISTKKKRNKVRKIIGHHLYINMIMIIQVQKLTRNQLKQIQESKVMTYLENLIRYLAKKTQSEVIKTFQHKKVMEIKCMVAEIMWMDMEIQSTTLESIFKTLILNQLLFLQIFQAYFQKIQGMTSALELEKKLEILTDQVRDIFHAISINIEALNVQVSHKNIPKEMENILKQCSLSLVDLKQLMQERSTLRLNYLITQQIKQEQAKVRRQRLNDYQQKILDQRRLISDKQAFYQNLLRPKKKRPPNMPLQEFQDMRRKQIAEQQNRKYEMLKNQVQKLSQLYQILRNQNNKIQQDCRQLQKSKQNQCQKRQDLTDQIKNNRNMFQLLNQALLTPDITKYRDLFLALEAAKSQNQNLFKQYEQQKEMEQYLQWEKDKLINQYKHVQQELNQCRKNKAKKQVIFKRPISR